MEKWTYTPYKIYYNVYFTLTTDLSAWLFCQKVVLLLP